MPASKIRFRALAATASLGLVASLGVAMMPAQAAPDIKDVQAKVDKLYLQAEQATEDYNEAQVRLSELSTELTSLKADQQRQARALDAVKEQLRDSMLHRFEGSQISAVGQAVLADDSRAFLSQLTTMTAFDNLQSSLYDDYSTQSDALELRRDATQERADEVSQTKKKLGKDKTKIESKLAEAKDLLSELKEKEREEILSRGGSMRLPSDISASGSASAAVAYATAQMGDAYVWGAAGPSAFDCSGLTMQAWAQAGVSLPHSSRAQFSSGPRVAESDLRAGDLVFFYTPISHVGMYIGNGMMVHAARPGQGVKVSSIHEMPYVGAVRPG